MSTDVKYLNFCMEQIDANIDRDIIYRIHQELKIYTPVGVSDIDADVLYMKAYQTCPPDMLGNPSYEVIRQCDMCFCKLLMQKLKGYDRNIL